jgi:predicted ferric reductase
MRIPGPILVAVYVILVIAPVVLATWLVDSEGGFLEAAGKSAALAGFTILALQVILSARLKWVSRPFGLDIVLRFHRNMALLAGLLLVAHPLLLAAGGHGSDLTLSLDVPWYILVGKVALALLLLNLAMSAFRRRLNLSFERWRRSHGVLGVLLLAGPFVHGWYAGSDLEHPTLQALWVALMVVVLAVLAEHRLIGPARRRRRRWRVANVVPEVDDVWTLEFEPPEGLTVPDHLPGQFHFITLHRGRGLPEEEHHFTISSAPTQAGRTASTIKAVGDFTRTIGDTREGDEASIQGAFGRFSYRLHPDEHDLVFIAGGIGITPLMSMLRSMRDGAEDHRVLLLYGNRQESAIIFREELAAIEAGEHPRLEVVHMLSHADEDWTGEKGYIDREKIERLVGTDLSGKTFYVCGPPAMNEAAISSLKALGVEDRMIRTEIFSLVD